jgi:hypothetical protein
VVIGQEASAYEEASSYLACGAFEVVHLLCCMQIGGTASPEDGVGASEGGKVRASQQLAKTNDLWHQPAVSKSAKLQAILLVPDSAHLDCF